MSYSQASLQRVSDSDAARGCLVIDPCGFERFRRKTRRSKTRPKEAYSPISRFPIFQRNETKLEASIQYISKVGRVSAGAKY